MKTSERIYFKIGALSLFNGSWTEKKTPAEATQLCNT